MYAAGRAAAATRRACAAFRGERDELFATHPQPPLTAEARAAFAGVPCFPHRPELRVEAELEPEAEGPELVIPTSTGEPTRFTRIGARAAAPAGGREVSLAVYWLEGYGGGLFLPFRDALAGGETYGGGRYLLDTVKGADLGTTATAPARARLQLRLQPLVRLRPALELPAGAAREPPRVPGRGRRADARRGINGGVSS